jgi:putative SOS response-associated peptidase YedK
MCSVFSPTQNVDWVREQFGVQLAGGYPEVTYPGYLAPVVLKSHASGRLACGLARFGLVPSWAKGTEIGRRTYNARSESDCMSTLTCAPA